MSSLFRRSFISTSPLVRELNKVYGLSFFKSTQLLKKFGLHYNCKVNQISQEILGLLCKNVENNFLADVDLKKTYMASIRRCASFKNHHAMFLRIKLKKDKDDVS